MYIHDACNPAGVEPIHWKQPDVHPGFPEVVQSTGRVSSDLMVQIKQKSGIGVETPPLEISRCPLQRTHCGTN